MQPRLPTPINVCIARNACVTAMTLNPATLPLPDLTQTPAQLKAATEAALAAARTTLAEAGQVPATDRLAYLERLEQADEAISAAFGLLGHLNAVQSTPERRDTYNSLLPALSAYYTEQGQNRDLYALYQALQDSDGFPRLSPARQEAIRLGLRDFRLSGVALEGEAKARYAEVSARLSELSAQFADHVLDATQAWVYPLSEAELDGLPDSALGLLRQLGQQKGFSQPVATLDGPAYLAVMTHARNRALRETVYHAYATRASELGAAAQDNSALMTGILALRQEMADLLGFASYAELSLASKMADSPAQVEAFLQDLARHARPAAERDLALLQQEGQRHGLDTLQPWDVTFLAERLREREYNLSQEALRPYFPLPVVLRGLFAIAQRLYGLSIQQKTAPVWAEGVQYFEIEEHGQVLGGFYLDLYAREGKRGGAWMSGYRSRRQFGTDLQKPLAFMVGNFAPPVGDRPALLTHDELVTLFHEFGHGLHHLLTEVNVHPVAGIHGVAWDAVELPSQFMEFWTWEREALGLISAHHEQGDPLPDALLNALLAARHFQSGLMALRQIEFALFDLRVHACNPAPDLAGIQALIDQVRRDVALIQPPAYQRFQHSFSHIFAGGYAAGYYSYKWAELLASDAFDRFEQEGIFNADTGAAFRREILAVGGSRPAQDSFAAFRGREPRIEALLRHSGWTATPPVSTPAGA